MTAELTTFDFKKIAGHLLTTDDCPPIMIWGKTGVGKSELVRQITHEISNAAAHWTPADAASVSGALEVTNDWGLIDLRISLLEPSDLLGLPDLKGALVRWVSPSELPVIGQEKRFPQHGILFLDELTHAQPAMQSACFCLVLDRRCGPHRLLPGWKIVAASNCTDENANTFPMSAPLRNRFAHFHLRCSLDAFKEWALRHDVDPRILAFLNWNPAMLHQASENPEESFPTPRSWVAASRLLGRFTRGDVEPAIAACVGPGTATIFTAFLQLDASSELSVDVNQVLRGKAKPPKLTMEKPDLAWAFTGRVTAAVQQTPKLLSAAVGFYCSPACKDVREIGRTGLADLKYVAPAVDFNDALAPHLETCAKVYGGLLA